jgi:hypothetical protein
MMLIDDASRPIVASIDSPFIAKYENIFVKLRKWGKFEDADLDLNDMRRAPVQVPDFVAEFRRRLCIRPGLATHVRRLFEDIYFPRSSDRLIQRRDAIIEYLGDPELCSAYFRTPEEDETERIAGRLEVNHITHIASIPWNEFWVHNLCLKEGLANTIFFTELWYCFTEDQTITAQLYVSA